MSSNPFAPAEEVFSSQPSLLSEVTRLRGVLDDSSALDSLPGQDREPACQDHVERGGTHTCLGARGPVSCSPAPFDAPSGTNCPRPDWLDAMVLADPAPDKIFMDVGCNKGDDALELLERWSPQPFFSKRKWLEAMRAEQPAVVAHACGEPSLSFKTRGAGTAAGKPVGVCVEPMESTVQLLRAVSKRLGFGAPEAAGAGALEIVQAALADKAKEGQTVDFPDSEPGMETRGMSALQRPVNLSTVDGLKRRLRLERVDILRIDTEGADPLVLEGAKEALKSVRYLEFEVHRDLHATAWEHTTLKLVLAKLTEERFNCFWAGNNGLLLSLNDCWSEDFERGTWANVVCVKRGDVWEATLQSFARP